jgi:nucleotide-binding universal stress UspA family protein
VFVVAAVTTAVLSLDATVVLLTPVVFATAARVGARPRPHVYACTHLANSASLLLPVSNLTNLLAFTASGLTFIHFAGLMAAPWLVAIAVEYVVFRRFFSADLNTPAQPPTLGPGPPVPLFVVGVLALTLAGFVLSSVVSVNPAWAALAGAVLLATRALRQKKTTVRAVIGATSPLFLVFVLALGVIVKGVLDNGLDRALSHALPAGSTLPALLGVAALHPPRAAHRAGRARRRGRGTVGRAACDGRLTMPTNVIIWVAESTWAACVDAAHRWVPADADIVLLHVTDDEVAAAAHAAFAGLLGRAHPHDRDPGARVEALSASAAAALLAAAAERLARPATRVARHGRVEHEVVHAAAGADLLICARDGDRRRLGPHSLAPPTRFVVDHAPCPVLLVWPEQPPGVDSIPPPPPHHPPHHHGP